VGPFDPERLNWQLFGTPDLRDMRTLIEIYDTSCVDRNASEAVGLVVLHTPVTAAERDCRRHVDVNAVLLKDETPELWAAVVRAAFEVASRSKPRTAMLRIPPWQCRVLEKLARAGFVRPISEPSYLVRCLGESPEHEESMIAACRESFFSSPLDGDRAFFSTI
jgi:hypothetical protein